MDNIIYYIASIGAMIFAGLSVTHKNPVYCGLFLIPCFFLVGIVYLLHGLEFFAVLQVLVYAGAIMVLFLFIIMLLDLTKNPKMSFHWKYPVIVFLLIALLLKLIDIVHKPGILKLEDKNIFPIKEFAHLLFGKYFIPFQFISLLMVVSIVGAVVIAKKQYTPRDP